MQDHGLFQAICRVNRLDGDDKEYGYIIDYKDLFRSLEGAIKDYTGEAFGGYDKEDVEGLLKDRLQLGRERLVEAREAVMALCEPVDPPRDTAAYVRYFCAAEGGNAEQLKDNEPKRVALYKLAAAYLRAFANLANEMQEAGYTNAKVETIRNEVDHYEKVRQEVKLASGDYVDMKMFEPAMRHLLDTYIRAEESEKVSAFDDLTLVELIVQRGEAAVDALPDSIRKNREAMAETIENNVRRLIIDEMSVNPKYYEKMSKLLDALIEQRRQEALDYQEYLKQIVELSRQVSRPESQADYPAAIDTGALRALYDNLDIPTPSRTGAGRFPSTPAVASTTREKLAVALDYAIRAVKKADWRGNRFKEREVHNAIRAKLGEDDAVVDRIFEIVKAQREY
jgi:type I restriction enzyme R subunit